MAKFTKAAIEEAYEEISETALNRMLLLRDDYLAATSIRGRRPSGPVEMNLVDHAWEELTAKGNAVLKYHDSL